MTRITFTRERYASVKFFTPCKQEKEKHCDVERVYVSACSIALRWMGDLGRGKLDVVIWSLPPD